MNSLWRRSLAGGVAAGSGSVLSRPPTGMARGRAAAARGVGGSCPADLGAAAFCQGEGFNERQRKEKSFVSGLRPRPRGVFCLGMQPEKHAVVDADGDGDDENDDGTVHDDDTGAYDYLITDM